MSLECLLTAREQAIHKNFKISRVHNFYMRKVKFTQHSFNEKPGSILEELGPIIEVSRLPLSRAGFGLVNGRMRGMQRR